MGHVFRINKKGSKNNQTTIVDWSTTAATTYNHGYVNAVTDTTTTQKEITSIPSPFARIELVKEAFNKVVPDTIVGMNIQQVQQCLHGNTIYHKMVSDTLDVAQLFFSFPALQDKLEIVVWQRSKEIQALSNSSLSVHQIVGKTLDMFLSQDAKGNDPYNFGKMNNIYILRYKGPGQKPMHIIGATSPATLFFSTANDETAISKELCFVTDYAFDTKYASLDERNPEFLKYLYTFRYSNPNFNAHYPEVAHYLDAVYYVLDDNLKNEINDIQNSCQTIVQGQKSYIDSNYEVLDVTVNATTTFQVEINGFPFHCNKPTVAGNSDFEINSSQNTSAKPLVLPVIKSSAYEKLTYLGASFGRNIQVPYYDSVSLETRHLPGINVPYPYLTISDFLCDKIVKLPSAVNTDYFFDGNYCGQSEKKDGYLIPVTDLYFNYFSVNDLMGCAPSGKNTIDIKSIASGVEVTLRIPIQNNNEIEYKRIYTLDVKADPINNKGAIVLPPEDFAVGVFPPVKFSQASEAYYRIVLVGDYVLNKDFSCICHNQTQGLFTPGYVVRNSDIDNDDRTKVYIIDKQTFDYARISIKTKEGKERSGNGLMIPKFKQKTGNSILSFAIDFGTSNTHIEYSTGQNMMPQAFEFGKEQPQLSLLFIPGNDTPINHLRGEFIPEAIGAEAICRFPMRTVLCIDKNNTGINESGKGSYVALGNASPAFMYNKSVVGPKYNNYIPNLKWSQMTLDNEEKIRCYIESLFMMIRTKVIQSGANLSQTQIMCFYPISMSPLKQGLFRKMWDNAYHKYFNTESSPILMTESIAPYSFFQQTRPDVSDIVTIDIGGGTTDVVVADANGVKCITSMRFAADAIFGNTLVAVNNGSLNGIIRQFKDEFIANLEGTKELKEMLVNMTSENLGNSSEVASFLFSLSENEEIKKFGMADKVDFNAILARDNTQKIVFYIFYSAIIYHIANLMKVRGLQSPSNIAFSGNGSKVISVLTPNQGTLEELTTKIFKSIYSDTDIKDIKLIINRVNPKEATCKGGLFLGHEPNNIRNAKTILLTDKLVTNENYNNVETLYEDVIDEVRKFVDLIFLKLAPSISLSSNFGIDPSYTQLAIRSCFRNESLETYIEKGVNLKLQSKDVSKEDVIEETLFFYPIIGAINDLSNRICDMQQNENIVDKDKKV